MFNMTFVRARGPSARSLACVCLSTALLAVTGAVDAAHHRFSHIHWTLGAGPNEINFVVQNAWNATCCHTCVNPNNPVQTGPAFCSGPGGTIAVGDVVSMTGGPPPRLQFGDGSEYFFAGGFGSMLYVATAIDPPNNWFFGTVIDHTQLPNIVTTFSHTYAAPGNYTAHISACCRIAAIDGPNAHVNNPLAPYRIQTTVNVGSGNSSPVSLVPPIVHCPINGLCTFQIVAADPDGDALNFRLSTPMEATGGPAFNQPGPPHAPNAASVDSVTGVYTWDTTGALLGPPALNTLYSTHVTIEDLDANGNVESAVAVDFFIQLVEQVGDPPDIDIPGIVCGSTVVATEGDTLSFTVNASDPDVLDTVTLNVIGLPAGATMNPPLPQSGTAVSSDFTWTPTPADIGPHIIIFTATDQTGQSSSCALTIVVEEAPQEIAIPFDIRPTSCPNPFNPQAKGVLPTAILGTASFDVLDVDPASVRLVGVAPVRHDYEDVATPFVPFLGKTNPLDCTTAGTDGFLNLTLKFNSQSVAAAISPVSAGDVLVLQVTGELFDGTPIIGEDVIVVVGPGGGGGIASGSGPGFSMHELIDLLRSWGPCPPRGPCPADLNGDGVVDADDLVILLTGLSG